MDVVGCNPDIAEVAPLRRVIVIPMMPAFNFFQPKRSERADKEIDRKLHQLPMCAHCCVPACSSPQTGRSPVRHDGLPSGIRLAHVQTVVWTGQTTTKRQLDIEHLPTSRGLPMLGPHESIGMWAFAKATPIPIGVGCMASTGPPVEREAFVLPRRSTRRRLRKWPGSPACRF